MSIPYTQHLQIIHTTCYSYNRWKVLHVGSRMVLSGRVYTPDRLRDGQFLQCIRWWKGVMVSCRRWSVLAHSFASVPLLGYIPSICAAGALVVTLSSRYGGQCVRYLISTVTGTCHNATNVNTVGSKYRTRKSKGASKYKLATSAQQCK